MKHILLLLCAILGTSQFNFAQSSASQKQEINKVVLKNKKTAKENYDAILKILAKNKVNIDQVDTLKGELKTVPYALFGNLVYKIKEQISWKNGEVNMQTYSIDANSNYPNFSVVTLGVPRWSKIIFTNMRTFCKQIGGKVYFEAQ